MGHEATPEGISALVKELDTDGDGRVDLTELLGACAGESAAAGQ